MPAREAGSRQRFTFTFMVGDELRGCEQQGSPAPHREILIGSVLYPQARSFQLDTCLPTADCKPSKAPRFTFAAPSFPPLDRYLSSGAFVRVEIETRSTRHCGRRILVQSLDRWEGTTNPVPGRFLLAGNDGVSDAFESSAFSAVPEPAGCRLRLSILGKPARTFPPGQGPTDWAVTNSEVWTVWNGSSSLAENCSDEASWSYWITGEKQPQGSTLRLPRW